jgi:hypothetical protein
VSLGRYGLVGFLRGLLTNLGTQPATSVIRSILAQLGTGGPQSAAAGSRPKRHTRHPHHLNTPARVTSPRSRSLGPSFFSREPSRLLRRGRADCEASASIPRPDGRPTWFVDASAASRSGRGPISRTAFRCAASERMERATGSICPIGVTTGIIRCLSPWLLRHLPPISRPDRLPFAFEAGGLNTLPAKRGLNIERL